MDSPVRKQQKRNDYLRHKMFRKINRRKKAERKQAIEAPMKELKRRLRRYDGGKKPEDDIIYETQNTEDGTVYRVHPSAFGAKELNVTTPEVVVKTRDPRKPIPTAYHPEDVEQMFNLTGVGMLFNPFRLARTSKQLLDKPSFNNAVEVAHDALPWSKAGRFLLGAYNLGNENGLAKTKNLIEEGRYGRAALSAFGDILNATMMAEGGAGVASQLRSKLIPKPVELDLPNQHYGLTEPESVLDQPAPNLLSLTRKRKPYQQPQTTISTKDINKIVDKDGNVDWDAFGKAMDYYYGLTKFVAKETGWSSAAPKYTMQDIVGADRIIDHTKNVVKSAQDAPVPKGYTKQQQVQAALLHDIGKIQGYVNHGSEGRRILHPSVSIFNNDIVTRPFANVSDDVLNAVGGHMSTLTYGSKNNLLRATQFADVARGKPYDEAAVSFPHLLYEREGLAKPKYPSIPLRTEIRDYINPWLKENGYGPQDANGKYTGIPLDATEEQAWQIVEDAVDQHLSMLRGGRLSDSSSNMSPQTIAKLNKDRDEALRELIKDREITDEDKLLFEMEHMNSTPTGYGRLGIFDNHQPRDGMAYNLQQRGLASEYYKIDPDVYDAKYTSYSDQTSNTYSGTAGRNDRANMQAVLQLPKIERTPEMSMREYIMRNDWDLYSGEKEQPIGLFNMLEMPFRLQTGKSLKYEAFKKLKREDPEKVSSTIYRDKDKPVIKPIKELEGSEYNDPFSMGYDRYREDVDDVNNLVKRIAPDSDFDIRLGKNEEIYYPDQIWHLRRKLLEAGSIKDEIDGIIAKINDLKDPMAARSYKHKVERFANRQVRAGRFSKKEYDILLKQLRGSRPEKAVQYLQNKAFAKRMFNKAKEEYFAEIRHINNPFDIRAYNKLISDPQLLMQTMREFGALPRHELPGFNRMFVISTAGGTRQKGKNISPSHNGMQQAIIGNMKTQEKVVNVKSSSVNTSTNTRAEHRDAGVRSSKKLSKKTLASLLPFIFLPGLKNTQKEK